MDRPPQQSGFTLVELLIVVVIVSVLMAVAAPIYIGKKQKAIASTTKAMVRAVHESMESCGAAMSTGEFTDDNDAIQCSQRTVRADMPEVGRYACGDQDTPRQPRSTMQGRCWSLYNSMNIENHGYTILAKSDNQLGPRWGYFALHRTAQGVVRVCGASTIDGGWDGPPINERTARADFTNLFVGRGDETVRRQLCPTGTW